MHLNAKMYLETVYTLDVWRPNWLGRIVQWMGFDLAQYPPELFNWLVSYRGSVGAHNIIPTEGRNSILDVVFHATTQITAWFCGLFEANYTPVAGDTMALFPAAATECTAYAETTRPAWVEGAASAGVTTNSASTATFTFNATKTLYGAFLSSSSVKGGTSGVLVSAAKFSASKSVDSGDLGRLTASITFTSS